MTVDRPPRIPLAILLALAPRDRRHELEGDLTERFRRTCESEGTRAARRQLWKQLLTPTVVLLRVSNRGRTPAQVRPGAARSRRRSRLSGARPDDLARDARLALRSVRFRPGPSAVVIATLAIAVGASSAILTVVNRVLLRPLPYPASGELAMVFRTVPQFGFEYSSSSYPDFADWWREARSFRDLAAFTPVTRTVASPEGARQWTGFRVTTNLFDLLGTEARVGRGLTAADADPAAPYVVVISDAVFRSRFGANPSALEAPVSLDGRLVRVVGVMPAGLSFPDPTAQFWEPLRPEASWQRGDMFLRVIGRLAPGRTAAEAQAELASLAARVDVSEGGSNEDLGVKVEGRHAYEVRAARPALWVFLGGASLLLAIACVNITNVQLSRALARRREIGVRAALGAGRSRIATQFLVENLVLAAMGGTLGLAIAWGLLEALLALAPPGLPRAAEIGIDGWIVLFTILGSLAAGAAFGVPSALWGARQEVGETGRGGMTGARRSPRVVRAQETFASTQIALAVALSIGGGLLLQSFARLMSVDPGFDPSGIVVARIKAPGPIGTGDPPSAGDAGATARDRFYAEIRDRLERVTGVTGTGLAYVLPFGGVGMARPLAPEAADTDARGISGNIVSPGFFRTMGIRLLAGREFTALDAAGRADAVIVSATLARRFWPRESALGKRLVVGEGDASLEVVGVVGDVRHRSLEDDEVPFFYRPLAQEAGPDALFLVVRSALPVADVAALIRREVAAMAPHAPVSDLSTSSALIDRSVATPRFRAIVVTAFGTMGLILSVIGVYGVLAHAVGERRREMGIRMALGAGGQRIIGMVLRRGMRLATVGVLIGIGGALGLTGFLGTMLYGVGTRDPAVFAATAAVALAVTLLACYLPARRASRADPLQSLRSD